MVAADVVGAADHDRASIPGDGTQKLLGFQPPPNPGPALFSLLGLQGIIELVGGILILIGFLTRPVAFVLADDMAVAYFMAHGKLYFAGLRRGRG